ncbi:crotonase/enoyl-CoA hydratase family protein [Mycobacterium vicinigordonae]|uniref:Crotonase/enoyl-CoA hydratase family protein n=1 Tax=Mycobacterium vicinigordonae TaxID=1719132 RepID=A0A7D6ISA3_9MYCO|nr:crotonase/enoyl-CoA hydratase family protein [Mycobacterium vicinigordonae]QLL07579.1 crotonase/enoyl-CoA hydratase family protein [Mycobacterium vicinigordonae]
MSSRIDVEITVNTAVLTINRPSVRNAIDLATAQQIAAALDDFDRNKVVRTIVITGSGGFFSAGMDLKALAATNERPISDDRGAFGIVEKPPIKPLIAAVEGAALGGGLEIALTADIIVAAQDAKFGLPEVSRGLVATAGGAIRLPTRIPRALALEMIMTGAPISAKRAYEIGLVNHVVPPGTTLAAAREIAGVIARNAPIAVRAAKAVASRSSGWPEADAFTLQRRFTDPVRESADAAEGARAFIEKRPPVWRDA